MGSKSFLDPSVCTEEKAAIPQSKGIIDLLGNAYRLTLCGFKNGKDAQKTEEGGQDPAKSQGETKTEEGGQTTDPAKSQEETKTEDVPAVPSGTELSPEETAFFDAYAARAQAVLDRFKGTPLTGESYRAAAIKAYLEHGRNFERVVPVDLALAQGQFETRFGTDSSGRPNYANNIYNVGEFDSGTTDFGKGITSTEAGMDAYFALMADDYLSHHTPAELLQNFVNGAGSRYASNPEYEKNLRDQIAYYVRKHGDAPVPPAAQSTGQVSTGTKSEDPQAQGPDEDQVEVALNSDPFADWIQRIVGENSGGSKGIS